MTFKSSLTAGEASRSQRTAVLKREFERNGGLRQQKSGTRTGGAGLPASWFCLAVLFLLAAATISNGFSDTTPERILLPIEVFSADGAPVSRTVELQAEQAESAQSLWLEIHGVRYAGEASVQVNTGQWIPLDDSTVTIAEPGRSFGGIGGGFSTLRMTLPLPGGTLTAGANTVRFRFNRTDGFISAYRVLAWNFLTSSGKKILPPEKFVEDDPGAWKPPLADAASIQAGKELWHTASLEASSLPNAPRLLAHCADCHAQDGRDLKYFNFSNASIVDRSRFHGLSKLQGEQIASYIRGLPFPSPGRPWNPPYQPGPGLDEKPIADWAAGAGLQWVFEKDLDTLPYVFGLMGSELGGAPPSRPGTAINLADLADQITPKVFRPDGNLNAHEIPIGLQLPDWSEWLPRIHPKDAWGSAFTQSDFAALYDGNSTLGGKGRNSGRTPLRKLLAGARAPHQDVRDIAEGFSQWSQSRRIFLKRFVEGKKDWPTALTNKVYSTQLWQLVKTWEMMQEFGLEGRGRDFFGPAAESRSWFNTVPQETAPSTTQIPDGASGVGGSALNNEYFSASWYELQIILNSGSHQHRDRGPVDWVYVVGRFHDLFEQTHRPEPARLLVAVIKALQSTDPRVGPEDFSRGWRPDQNVDPRIMVSAVWAPFFDPLPAQVHQALTASLLAAWMEKNQQYPIEKFLPMGARRHAYTAPRTYGEITGGKVWEASTQFRDAGVSPELVRRLQQWGLSYHEREVRIQY